MESSGQRPPSDPEVPLGDAAIATEIANAAARGRGADRAPTLDQLLAAFGETAPTEAARRRVAAALRVAGMGVRPDLMSAEPGQRLMLLPPGSGGGRSRARALLGLVGVAAILVAAAAGASLLDGGGDGGGARVADSLPAETSTAAARDGSADTPATTATETAATDTTATETTATTAPTPDHEDAAAAARRRKQAARRKRERQAAARRRAAAARTTVTVRVDATGRPTFLCVDDGRGKTLFSGTLDGKRVFKARRVRMNIGLASTLVTVNGNPVRLNGSPDGLDVTRAGGAKTLPLGQRPCA